MHMTIEQARGFTKHPGCRAQVLYERTSQKWALELVGSDGIAHQIQTDRGKVRLWSKLDTLILKTLKPLGVTSVQVLLAPPLAPDKATLVMIYPR